MFISLRESSLNGFKRWSGSLRPKDSGSSGTNDDNAVVAVTPASGSGSDPSAINEAGRLSLYAP